MPLRTVLCGVDHSGGSHAAATHAAALAERLGLRLVLLHAVPAAVTAHAETLPHALASTGATGARTLLDAVQEVDDPRAAPVVVRGAPGPRLVAVAAAADAAFVVVGSRAMGPLSGAVPLDFAARLEHTERRALAVLHRVLDGLEHAPAAEVSLRHGHAGDQLAALARRDRTGLVVVGSRGKGPLRAALLGSTSTQLVRDSHVPVVVCPRD